LTVLSFDHRIQSVKVFSYIFIFLLPLLLNASINIGVDFNYEKDSLNLFSVKPYISLDTSGFSVVFQPNLKFIDTTLPPRMLFKNIVGMNMQSGYISYENSIFFMEAGKKSMRWGEGVSPLLFSGYLPVNNVMYGLKYKNVEMTCAYILLNRMYTTLNDVVGDTSTTKYHFNRFISAHKIEFLIKKTKIALSEVALIYYKDGESFPLQFLNPLNVMYVLQWNDPDEGNTIPTNLFWDLSLERQMRNHNFYLELLIDDFQYDNPPSDMNEPNHLAFTTGDSFVIGDFDIIMEYSIASRWVYGLYAPAGRYTAYGFPIGTEEGNDFDRVYLNIKRNIGSYSLYFKGTFKRKGEGRLDITWPSGGGFREEEFPDKNFLAGNVKHYICPKIGFGYKTEKMELNVEVGDLYEAGTGNSITANIRFIYKFLGSN